MAAKRQSRGQSRHGGKRRGAGRKTLALTALRQDTDRAARDLVAGWLPELLGNLKRLADGGYERIEETWEPAGLILIDAPALDADGHPLLGPRGGAVTVKRSAFPDLPPDQPVLVSRRREIADGDREANKYLVDRVLGRPKQAVEMSGPDGNAIPIAIEQLIGKVYGDDAD